MPEDNTLRKALQLLEDAKRAKVSEGKRIEEDRKNLILSVGKQIVESLAPFLKTLISQSKSNQADLERAISKIRVDVQTPEVVVPDIRVPEPRVTVNVPPIRVPDVVMPDEMNVRGFVKLMDIDINNPLPVELRDSKGNPVNLFENLTSVIGGGGGGKRDFLTIKDIRGSSASVIDQTEGALKVTGTVGVSGSQSAYLIDGDGNYRGTIPISAGSTLEVIQVSGATSSENITQLGGTAIAVNNGEATNGTLRTVVATDSIVSVNIVSGSSSGTQYTDGSTALTTTGTVAMGDTGEESGNVWSLATAAGATGSNVLRVNFATDSIASVNIVSGSSSGTQYSDGDTDTTPTGTLALGWTGDDGSNLFALKTHSGVVGSGVLRVVHVADVGLSVSATQVTSPWVVSATDLDIRDLNVTQDELLVHQVSGANWSVNVPGTVTVTGSLTSAVVVGPTPADTADDGNAPLQIGGIARTANPTAVAANDVVKATFDDVGRQVMRPVQVRDLLQTARAQLTNGTETTLLAGVSGVFHDLVYIMGANNSDVAVSVDIRSATAGGIQMTLQIPANSTAGVSVHPPIPQDVAADTWTGDMSDITGTTVTLTGLFSKEV